MPSLIHAKQGKDGIIHSKGSTKEVSEQDKSSGNNTVKGELTSWSYSYDKVEGERWGVRWELRGELGGIGELEGELGGRRELGGEGVFGGGEQRVKYLRKCVLKHIAA